MTAYDRWLLFDCTDDYDEDAPENIDDREPDDDHYIDDERNNYIGG